MTRKSDPFGDPRLIDPLSVLIYTLYRSQLLHTYDGCFSCVKSGKCKFVFKVRHVDMSFSIGVNRFCSSNFSITLMFISRKTTLCSVH